MDILKIVAELKKYDIVPVPEGDKIRLTGNTEALPARLIETVTANKETLLKYLHSLQHQMDADSIPVAAMKPWYPCTASQKRMWYLSQFDNSEGLYNILVPVHIRGYADEKKVQSAFSQLVERHAILPCLLSVIDGQLFQRVGTGQEFTLDCNDQVLEKDKAGWLRGRIAELQRLSFQLDKDRLFRVELVKISSGEYVLLLVIHHIISDGWSVRIMLQEVVENYGGGGAGGGPAAVSQTCVFDRVGVGLCGGAKPEGV